MKESETQQLPGKGSATLWLDGETRFPDMQPLGQQVFVELDLIQSLATLCRGLSLPGISPGTLMGNT